MKAVAIGLNAGLHEEEERKVDTSFWSNSSVEMAPLPEMRKIEKSQGFVSFFFFLREAESKEVI